MGAASELASLGVKISNTHLTHLTKSYPLESIKHVAYYAVQTAQMSGGALSEITSEAKCRLHFNDGRVLNFKAKSGSSFSNSQHPMAPVWLLKEVVSEATFETRLARYQHDIESRRFFNVGKFQFHVDGSIYRRARRVLNLKAPRAEADLQPFTLVGSDGGKPTSIPIDVDQDCILHLVRAHYSLYWQDFPYRQPRSQQQRAFFLAVVRLGAKMAKSDGAVSADEIRQFKSYFGTDQYPLEDVASVFREAVSDGVPIYQAARTLADVAADPSILEQVLIGLIGIASVDGVIHDGEAAAIRDVGRAFSVTADRVELLLNAHGPKAGTGQSSANQKHRTRKPKTPSPECLAHLKVLGLEKDATPEQIKNAYRSLATSLHPDLLRSKGLPDRIVQIASDTLAGANDSYNWLRDHGYLT